MRHAICLILLAVFTGPAWADDARSYVILSLLGDRLAIISPQWSTGTNLDKTVRDYLKLDTPAIDHAALVAADDVLRKTSPGAKASMLMVNDPAVYAAQARALDDGSPVRAILPTLSKVLGGAQATHLILFSKLRHDAIFDIDKGHVGSGKIEGLGFYIDRITTLRVLGDVNDDVGFLAPFAYFRISVVEIASGKVLADREVLASETHPGHASAHPWDELTPQQKVNALRTMLGNEITATLPSVLASVH